MTKKSKPPPSSADTSSRREEMRRLSTARKRQVGATAQSRWQWPRVFCSAEISRGFAQNSERIWKVETARVLFVSSADAFSGSIGRCSVCKGKGKV